MTDLSRLLAEVKADRETGTADAWWHSRIGDFALDVDYGTDEAVNGGQDAADRRRILRLASVERALIKAIGELERLLIIAASPAADPAASAACCQPDGGNNG